MDYAALLQKYMSFVDNVEGTDFVSDAEDYGEFTEAEKSELKRMSDENTIEWRKNLAAEHAKATEGGQK